MTIEIIVFIAAILFGIVWYVRESKNNKIYRFFNKLMHAKDLQMKADNKKGFVHIQPFLMRLVWVTVLFVLAAVIVAFVTPINGFYIQYFASAIVGTLIGTYIASSFFVASEELTKENIRKKAEEAYQKGKEFVEDLKGEEEEETAAETSEEAKPEEPETEKKSARDRLKDKGMIK
ncbi:MAG: hypothetical protein KTR22_14330 [Flavobacteriaceae bacterium]|nr:hypothetical protein [Flavobacteriaceae bacterium]